MIARRKERLDELPKRTLSSGNACTIRSIPLDLICKESFEAVNVLLEKEKPSVQYLVNAAGFGKISSSIRVDCFFSYLICLSIHSISTFTTYSCCSFVSLAPFGIRHPNVPEKRRRYQNPNVTLNDMMQSEFHVDEPCVKERRRNSMCKICKMDEDELRKFKKEHSTFIAVGTTLIIVGVAAGLWKMMKKCCRWKKNSCGSGADEA